MRFSYPFIALFLLSSCGSEERITPIVNPVPLSEQTPALDPALKKEQKRKNFVIVRGTYALDDIMVDQNANSTAFTNTFSGSLGKSISSVPGNMELDMTGLRVDAENIDEKIIKYISIEKVELEIPPYSDKGDLVFLEKLEIYLEDPKNKDTEIKVVDFDQKDHDAKCAKDGNCDWKEISFETKKINLIDYIKEIRLAPDKFGNTSDFAFKDINIRLKLKIDAPKDVKFWIRPKVKFVAGLDIN